MSLFSLSQTGEYNFLFLAFRQFSTELVYYIVKDGAVIDGRRIESEVNMTKIRSAVSTVVQPNRQHISPIADEEALTSAVPVDECYKHAVRSAVVEQDYVLFETSIKNALMKTSSGVTACHYFVCVYEC